MQIRQKARPASLAKAKRPRGQDRAKGASKQMIKIKRPFLVFSVAQGNDEDAFNHRQTAKTLRKAKVEYQEVVECYKGEIEKSFVVAQTERNSKLVRELCEEYAQESWLDVQKYGNVYLNLTKRNLDDPKSWMLNHLGHWEEASEIADLLNGPDGTSAWTFANGPDGTSAGTFYIIKADGADGAE